MEGFAETACPWLHQQVFASQASDLIVKSADNVGKQFDPNSRPLARRQAHLQGIMMTEQALGSVQLKFGKFSAPTVNIYFVTFHFFSHTSHELTPRVNLQQLRLLL